MILHSSYSQNIFRWSPNQFCFYSEFQEEVIFLIQVQTTSQSFSHVLLVYKYFVITKDDLSFRYKDFTAEHSSMFEMDVNSIGALENMLDFIWIFFFLLFSALVKQMKEWNQYIPNLFNVNYQKGNWGMRQRDINPPKLQPTTNNGSSNQQGNPIQTLCHLYLHHLIICLIYRMQLT